MQTGMFPWQRGNSNSGKYVLYAVRALVLQPGPVSVWDSDPMPEVITGLP
jgi:hypothetical protein